MERRFFFGTILGGWFLGRKPETQQQQPLSISFIVTPEEVSKLSRGETVEHGRQGEPTVILQPKQGPKPAGIGNTTFANLTVTGQVSGTFFVGNGSDLTAM